MKASSWPLDASCSPPKRNIPALRAACAKAIKRNNNKQSFRDNAYKFEKDPEVINVILVRRRNEIQQEETRNVEDLPEENHEARNDINNNDTINNGVVNKQTDELTEDDKELERFFQIQIEAIDHCSLLLLEPRKKLPNLKLTKKVEGSANRGLDRYLVEVNTIPEITDKVYVIGKASTFELGMKQPEPNGTQRKMRMK